MLRVNQFLLIQSLNTQKTYLVNWALRRTIRVFEITHTNSDAQLLTKIRHNFWDIYNKKYAKVVNIQIYCPITGGSLDPLVVNTKYSWKKAICTTNQDQSLLLLGIKNTFDETMLLIYDTCAKATKAEFSLSTIKFFAQLEKILKYTLVLK